MSAFSTAVLADTPALYWEFEEAAASGSGAGVDSSGNGRNGTNDNRALLGQASIFSSLGSSLQLGGGSYAVHYAIDAGMRVGTGDFTYEFVIKATVTGGTYNSICGESDGSGSHAHGVIAGPTGVARVYVGSGSAAIIGTINILDGNPHHVVAARISGVAYLYVDGVADGSAAATNDVDFGTTMYVDGIGQSGDFNPPTGDVGHFAYYTAGLSAARVAAHYEALTPGLFSRSTSDSATAVGALSSNVIAGRGTTDTAAAADSIHASAVPPLHLTAGSAHALSDTDGTWNGNAVAALDATHAIIVSRDGNGFIHGWSATRTGGDIAIGTAALLIGVGNSDQFTGSQPLICRLDSTHALLVTTDDGVTSPGAVVVTLHTDGSLSAGSVNNLSVGTADPTSTNLNDALHALSASKAVWFMRSRRVTGGGTDGITALVLSVAGTTVTATSNSVYVGAVEGALAYSGAGSSQETVFGAVIDAASGVVVAGWVPPLSSGVQKIKLLLCSVSGTTATAVGSPVDVTGSTGDATFVINPPFRLNRMSDTRGLLVWGQYDVAGPGDQSVQAVYVDIVSGAIVLGTPSLVLPTSGTSGDQEQASIAVVNDKQFGLAYMDWDNSEWRVSSYYDDGAGIILNSDTATPSVGNTGSFFDTDAFDGEYSIVVYQQYDPGILDYRVFALVLDADAPVGTLYSASTADSAPAVDVAEGTKNSLVGRVDIKFTLTADLSKTTPLVAWTADKTRGCNIRIGVRGMLSVPPVPVLPPEPFNWRVVTTADAFTGATSLAVEPLGLPIPTNAHLYGPTSTELILSDPVNQRETSIDVYPLAMDIPGGTVLTGAAPAPPAPPLGSPPAAPWTGTEESVFVGARRLTVAMPPPTLNGEGQPV